jgi:type II secretory pathway pseudopilin PulG
MSQMHKAFSFSKVRGFSLVEVLIIIATVGVLSSLAFVALQDTRIKARDAARAYAVNQIYLAVQLYKTQFFDAPHVGSSAVRNWSEFEQSLSVYLNAALPGDPGRTRGSAPYIYCSSGASYMLMAFLEKADSAILSGSLHGVANYALGAEGMCISSDGAEVSQLPLCGSSGVYCIGDLNAT